MALGTQFWGVSGAHTLDVLAAVALDTETTGLDTSVCHILQFGALSRAANSTPSGNFYDNMSVCSAATP